VREWSEIGVPVLAIEFLSPSTASRDRGAKRRIYQRAGVAEYWTVDLDARLVERWRNWGTDPGRASRVDSEERGAASPPVGVGDVTSPLGGHSPAGRPRRRHPGPTVRPDARPVHRPHDPRQPPHVVDRAFAHRNAARSRPQDTPPPVRIVLRGRDHRRIIRENVTNVRVSAGAAGQSLRKGGGAGPIPSVPVIRSPLVARKLHPSRVCSARRSLSRGP
jgi:hypothetical protein